MIPPEITTVSTTKLRRKAKAILKLAANNPVLITRYGQPKYVLMSAAVFKRIGGKNGLVNLRNER